MISLIEIRKKQLNEDIRSKIKNLIATGLLAGALIGSPTNVKAQSANQDVITNVDTDQQVNKAFKELETQWRDAKDFSDPDATSSSKLGGVSLRASTFSLLKQAGLTDEEIKYKVDIADDNYRILNLLYELSSAKMKHMNLDQNKLNELNKLKFQDGSIYQTLQNYINK